MVFMVTTMSKETYHVNNKPKSDKTWKLVCGSLFFVFGLVMFVLVMKVSVFYDVRKDGNFEEKYSKLIFWTKNGLYIFLILKKK